MTHFSRIALLLTLLLMNHLASAQVIISGNISDGAGGPLTTGTVYHASNIDVPLGTSLTIEPGAVIKFVGSQNRLSVHGTLTVNGTSGNPVIFTSISDDSAGGDTNGDGPSMGVPGSHRGVLFQSTANNCVATSMTVRYCGDNNNAGIRVLSPSGSFQSCLLEDCSGAGIFISGNSQPNVAHCHALRCKVAIAFSAFSSLQNTTSNTASECTTAGASLFTAASIPTSTATPVTKDQLVNGVLYFAIPLTIPIGRSLILGPGVTVKFAVSNPGFIVEGRLRCLGTAIDSVVFTSIQDDTYGGDTNGDNSQTSGAAGDWGTIIVKDSTNACDLNNTLIRNAGENSQPAIVLRRQVFTMIDSAVENCQGVAMQFDYLAGTDASPVITRSRFDNCLRAMDGLSFANLKNLRDNTATGNSLSNSPRLTAYSAANTPNVIRKSNLIDNVLIFTTTLFVYDLTILPGVILKAENPGIPIRVDGRIQILGTALEPVVITQFHDDEYGGDTNLDGSSSLNGLGVGQHFFVFSSNSSTMEHLLLRGSNGIRSRDPDLKLKNVRAEYCGTAFDLGHVNQDLDNLVAWRCFQGIHVTSGLGNIRHATVSECVGSGIILDPAYDGRVENTISWNNGTNYDGIQPGFYMSSNGDAALAGSLGNIFADPLFIDPSLTVGDLRLSTTSPCLGAADAAVATSVLSDHDDSTRIADYNFDGIAAPDMGAFEAANFAMAAAGRARVGESLTFVLVGPPGVGILYVGLVDGTDYFDPYGFYLAGSAQNVFYSQPVAPGYPYSLTIPNDPTLSGVSFRVQCGAAPLGNLSVGNLTNFHHTTIAD